MSGSPFHDGELAVQHLLGVRQSVQKYASRLIRADMPDLHRELYAKLPMLVVGSVSGDEQPAASLLFGRPGFVESPDARHLAPRARPIAGDPLSYRLRAGAPLGVLGIDLGTRRRTRANGRVSAVYEEGFELEVAQAFGNCPQHIRVREMQLDDRIDRPLVPNGVQVRHRLDESMQRWVAEADAFFIATAYPGRRSDPRRGVDVSHRGGAPGFVRVESASSLVFPDFGGNRFYNTIGNLVRHPLVGLLFVDFERGHLMQVEGRATVLWEDPLLAAYAGAERFVRVSVDRARVLEGVVPIRFGPPEPSKNEALVGSWAEAEAALSFEEQPRKEAV